jgi:glycosyltransferase involved in cell wall biosynthesis
VKGTIGEMKFSIVTPTYNSDKFLSETIQSVISQKGDFTIEYIIVDNDSQDDTIKTVRKYQRMLENSDCRIHCKGVEIKYFQEKDSGMYDAINKGFSRAAGDVYAWINSDDVYLPGAFGIIARSFESYPEVKWIKGITSYINEFSTLYEVGPCYLYDQDWLRNGVYGREAYFVQQDSVFWRAALWSAAGGIDTRFRRAGDYSLWIKFSKHAPLHSLKAYISCFRKVKGQLSQDVDAYRKECALISDAKGNTLPRNRIKLFFLIANRVRSPYVQKILYRIFFRKQKFAVIDVQNDGKIVLKTVSHYADSCY